MKAKVIKVTEGGIEFDNGYKLYSSHDSDCCESHELTFTDITVKDFEGLEFDLTNEKFFNKIIDYGIELVPLKGYSVKIPGHGYNNGYYGTNLDLVIHDGIKETVYDITECQVIQD